MDIPLNGRIVHSREALMFVIEDHRAAIASRIDRLLAAMEEAPKSRRWKMRARIGERKQWYEEPEEVGR